MLTPFPVRSEIREVLDCGVLRRLSRARNNHDIQMPLHGT
jgi:hypothetical protein